MSRLQRYLTTYWLDGLLLVCAVSSAVGTALRDDRHRPSGATLWFEVAAVAVVILALLLRRRLPFAAPGSVWMLSAALSFLDGRLVTSQPGAFLAGLAAALLLGHLRNGSQGWVGLAVVVAGAAVIVSNDPTHTTSNFVFTPAQFAIAWLVGYALRERTERTEAAEQRAAVAERERETAARIAVAEERARIARELHDVVAHAVSVMVLQVGAVRHRMGETDASRPALENVEDAGRAALAEMRRLLGAMRSQDEEPALEPQPRLADLATLLDDVRATGLAASLHVRGEVVDLPPGLDLSVYRIVQEGLTNILKHADAGRAEVELCYGPDFLEVQVRDDGHAPAGADGTGHGLVGIRERVKIYGGVMSAGPSPSGGFELRARLPLDGAGP